MRITQPAQSQTALQRSLYGGIALIVISMLFLGREQHNSSFLVQALTMMIAPAFFYVIGVLVCRYLNTVLVGPGIVATGGWLGLQLTSSSIKGQRLLKRSGKSA